MQNPANWMFRRKFAMTMYKNQKLPLAKMTFSSDFTVTDRGDLYPLIDRDESCAETVSRNRWYIHGKVARLLGQFFPYATYALTVEQLLGSVGFRLIGDGVEAFVCLCADERGRKLGFLCGEDAAWVEIPADTKTLIVSCRPGAFDVYTPENGKPMLKTSFAAPAFAASDRQSFFDRVHVAVCVDGEAEIGAAEAYLDNGIAQADLRPIRYENGEILQENGKIWLTASIRLEEKCFQGVFSWVPGTADLRYTGALFFDAGDGIWANDVASSILWHRAERRWYLWVCSFSHGHILGHAVIDGEVRCGVNVIDIELMPPAAKGASAEEFAGFPHDEDPDFYYDEERACWYMAICRSDPETGRYRYFFFRSAEPFANYRFIGKGMPGSETGGSFVRCGKQRLFVCGNSFEAHSDYRIYSENGMQNASFDYPDGGFRGWGTLMPIKLGTRTRWFWITFDRKLGSAFNWSYGNIYCFEAEIS